jgi:DNA polymerase-1
LRFFFKKKLLFFADPCFWLKNEGVYFQGVPVFLKKWRVVLLKSETEMKTFATDLLGLQNWFFDRDSDVYSFDTESIAEDDSEMGALDYSRLFWVGASFCDGCDALYVDLDVPERDSMIEFLGYQFANKIKKMICHNVQYDMMVLYKYGIKHTDKIFCTMVAAHLLSEHQPKALKELTYMYLPGTWDKIKKFDDIKDKGHHSYVWYDYGADDAIYTWHLYEKFYPWLRRDKLSYLMFKVEMPFQFCLRDLHINGILVDQKQLQSIEDEMIPIMNEAEDKMLDMLGMKLQIQKGFWEDTRMVSINFNSNKQVIPLLLERFNIKLTELTKTGEQRVRDELEVGDAYYKLDKIVLGGTKLDDGEIGGLAGEHPFCRELLIFRMAKDIKDKFTKKMKEHLSPDGRIRCSFNDTVAATGRLSSSDPNMQNLRKLNAILGVECRSCFVAPEGRSFVVADYAGQELRILAFVTQDPTLLDAYHKGLDLHLVTANLLFELGLTEEELTENTEAHDKAKTEHKAKRHAGKNSFNFPVIYGGTEYSISRSLGITVDEAKRLLNKFLDQYPGIKDGFDECEERIKLYGYVTNAAGRRRRFEEFTKRGLRQAFNFLIQGYAADMLRIGMVKILRDCILPHPEWDVKFVLTVHDEVVLECPDEYVDVVKDETYKAMTTAVDLGIPVECEVGTGKVYSEAK